MSDIHGCYETFLKMLKRIKFSNNDILYILGDVVDRGPEPIQALQYIMSKKNIFMIKGNHEVMMLECLLGDDIYNNVLWGQNGGDITWDQFMYLSEEEQNDMLKYLKELPNYIIVDDKILVHAGLYPPKILKNKDMDYNMRHQYEDDLLWSRDEFIFSPTNIENYTSDLSGNNGIIDVISSDVNKLKQFNINSVIFKNFINMLDI
jgi:serine/threonine protein phosphatase 1